MRPWPYLLDRVSPAREVPRTPGIRERTGGLSIRAESNGGERLEQADEQEGGLVVGELFAK